MGVEYRKIVRGRKLAERSYLYFSYPSKNKSIEFYLPFMENISISESQRSNLVTYDLIGRAGNLFAYTGSKSRELQLKFYITLPNIIDYIYNVGLSEMFSENFRQLLKGQDTAAEKLKFFIFKRSEGGSVDYSSKLTSINYYEQATKDMELLDQSFGPIQGENLLAGIKDFFKTEPWGLGKLTAPEPEVVKNFPEIHMDQAVNYLMSWINVIRTSTINNSTKTQYGPPTIYVNHGTMYNNIPCVCSNYSIRILEDVGYDLLSMAPRRIEVTMTLFENRVGNFGKFTPFYAIEDGDNLTGWESIVGGSELGTLDPHTQLLRMTRKAAFEENYKDSKERQIQQRSVSVGKGVGSAAQQISQEVFTDLYG